MRRRRTGWAAGAAAVAVAAVAVGMSAGPAERSAPTKPAPAPPGETSAPESEPAPAPRLAPSSLSYVDARDRLHIGDDVVPLAPEDQVLYVAGVTLVGPVTYTSPPPPSGPWRLWTEDGLVTLVDETLSTPGISLDGRLAAWVTRLDRDTDRVVLHDLEAGTEVDRIEVASPGQGALEVANVDAEGRVFLQSNRTGLVSLWAPGSDLVEVTGLPGVPSDTQWSGGLATKRYYEDTADASTIGTVAADGTFTPVGRVPRYGVWSPGARRHASVGWYAEQPGWSRPGGEVRVRTADDETVLALPAAFNGGSVRPVAWEDEATLALQVHYVPGDPSVSPTGPRGRLALLRCDVEADACEVAVDALPLPPDTGVAIGPFDD